MDVLSDMQPWIWIGILALVIGIITIWFVIQRPGVSAMEEQPDMSEGQADAIRKNEPITSNDRPEYSRDIKRSTDRTEA